MYHVGDIVQGKVEKILPTYLVVSTNDKYEGLLPINNISDYFVADITKIFTIGEKYSFEVLEVMEDKKRLKLAWKTIVPRFLKNPFDYTIEETKSGFKNLKKQTKEEIEND